MNITSAAHAASFETPNAVMRTYASPAVSGSEVAVWRTEMAPGAAGPLHAVSTEQVVVVIEGRPTVTVGGAEHEAAPGDGVVVPAGAERQISNPGGEPVVTLTCALPGASATRSGEAEPVPIPWAR